MPKNPKNDPLNARALGCALSILVALCFVALGILAFYGYGRPLVSIIGSIYIGYTWTPLGIALGAFYGFVWGLAHGWFIGFLYNWAYKKCPFIKR